MNSKDEGKSKTDKWQRWIAVATAAIAAVGAVATWTYNSQQSRLREVETVEKFFPHLISTDRRLSNMAKLTVKRLLSDKELAESLIHAAVEVTSEETATLPELTTEELKDIRASRTATVEGWAYLGNNQNGLWQTRYLDFPANADPLQLVGTKQSIREATGSLNLRQNIPTPEGTFMPVIDVLDPGTIVQVQEVQSWQSTGYTWAKVAIVK